MESETYYMTFYELSENVKNRCLKYFGSIPDTYLSVSIHTQTLHTIEKKSIKKLYTISTSKYGIGNRENSLQTPLGIHYVSEKIGHNAPLYTIFKDRLNTNRLWSDSTNLENLVLTRILRLKGAEPNFNLGLGIDSYDRCIYIHGTSKEHLIGTPFSYGCICMKNKEIIDLFDSIKEETLVIIDQ